MNTDKKICHRCLMDTTDPIISFNDAGICNHCSDFLNVRSAYSYKGEQSEIKFKALINEIKTAGKHRQYDCVVGLSGGIDSSYVAYVAKKKWSAFIGCTHG